MRQVLACVARAVEARYPLTMDDLSRLIVGTVDARIDAATGPYLLVSWKDGWILCFGNGLTVVLAHLCIWLLLFLCFCHPCSRL